ncbi:lytic transglycosylase domain-containing protein [Alicyclobacillus suci]|uniref:lytic transglycosylase domain-containing protein n=1 Tax=Alicyclobacillus suci TaxID=2816080 RepID=UPI001F1C8C92|nr:lytic transglycosylase domain-containing protein [Alicyclobacillus suci]
MNVSSVTGTTAANTTAATATTAVPTGNQIVSQWQSTNQVFEEILEETLEMLASEESSTLPPAGITELNSSSTASLHGLTGLSGVDLNGIDTSDSLPPLLLSLLPNFTGTTSQTPTSANGTVVDTGATGTLASTSAIAPTPSGSLASIINTTAEKYNLPPSLLSAVIQQESGFNPNAVSSAGAQGLMQLMPSTAQSLGVSNAFDPAQNVDAGASYLRQLLNQFGGSVPLALAAYNAGPGVVSKYQGVPPYAETQNYVQSILNHAGLANASTSL